jgi:hypothetical protein
MEDAKRPQLSDPQIELASDHAQAQLARMELLAMDEATRTGILRDVEGRLAALHGEPIRRGSDRWVFVTEHVVYKIPAPTSYGAGQAGIFASVSEGEAGQAGREDLAACRLVHTPEGVPVVIMERVEIEHEQIGDEQIGVNAAGERVRYDL